MQTVTILRHNQSVLSKLPRAAQAADKRAFTLLDKQARIWNRLNEILKRSRGEARVSILLVMSAILKEIDKGIAKRNADFKLAAEAAGIWKRAPKRKPKAQAKRRPKRAPKAVLAQVIKLRNEFRKLPKAA